jgi:phage-related tail fiber protein
VRYATVPEVQALADNTIAVTPFGLSGMVASTSQRGFVELADAAETQALVDTTRAVTPAGLGTLQATTTTRGLVQLNDTLTSTSTTEAPTARALKQAFDESIHNDIIQANGDLIVGRAASDPQILSKGFNGQVLTVDNTATLGVSWQTPPAPEATPVGAVCWFTTDDPVKLPVGWLVADGSSYSDSAADPYNELFQVIGLTFTPGTDPGGTFRVPDLRGQFIRGWNDAGTQGPGTLDPGRVFGSTQLDAFQQHSHSVTDPGHIHTLTDPGHTHTVTDPGHSHGVNDPGHQHQFSIPNAEVVGDEAGFYDGNNKIGNQNQNTTNSTAGVSAQSNFTGVTINPELTGITQTIINTTGLTVDNEPATAPSPNETRPVNFALVPIIKYRNPI